MRDEHTYVQYDGEVRDPVHRVVLSHFSMILRIQSAFFQRVPVHEEFDVYQV